MLVLLKALACGLFGHDFAHAERLQDRDLLRCKDCGQGRFQRLPLEDSPPVRYLTKIDSEGVPQLLQRICYNYHRMQFESVMFNGEIVLTPAIKVYPALGMFQREPTEEQWYVAKLTAMAQYLNACRERARPQCN